MAILRGKTPQRDMSVASTTCHERSTSVGLEEALGLHRENALLNRGLRNDSGTVGSAEAVGANSPSEQEGPCRRTSAAGRRAVPVASGAVKQSRLALSRRLSRIANVPSPGTMTEVVPELEPPERVRAPSPAGSPPWSLPGCQHAGAAGRASGFEPNRFLRWLYTRFFRHMKIDERWSGVGPRVGRTRASSCT